MSLLYFALMVAVLAALLFVMADTVLSVGRRPAWQTSAQPRVVEASTVHYLPKFGRAVVVPAPVEEVEEEEALAA